MTNVKFIDVSTSGMVVCKNGHTTIQASADLLLNASCEAKSRVVSNQIPHFILSVRDLYVFRVGFTNVRCKQ